MIILKDAYLVTLNHNNDCGKYSVLIDEDRIADIAKTEYSIEGDPPTKFQKWLEKYNRAEIIDCRKKIVMPAIVNSCIKSEGSFIKNLLKNRHYETTKGDLYTDFMFNYIYQELQTEEMKNDLYNIYNYSFSKFLKSGTVLFNEFSLRKDTNHFNPIQNVIKQTGQCISVCYPIKQDTLTLQSYSHLDPSYYLTDENQLTIYDVSSLAELKNKVITKLFLEVTTNKEVVEKFRSTFGKPVIKLLDEYGLIDNNTTLIDPLYLSYEELKIISDRKANVIICPSDLSHFTNRYFPLDDFINNNIQFTIATGWLGEDIFKEVRTFKNKYRELNISSEKLLRSITQVPRQLYFHKRDNEEMHCISSNKAADLIFIDLSDIRFQFYPESFNYKHVYDFLIENLSASVITDVMIKGDFKVKESMILDADEKQIINDSEITRKRLYKVGKYEEISERDKQRRSVEELDLRGRDEDEIKLFSDSGEQANQEESSPKEEFRIKGRFPLKKDKGAKVQKNLFDEPETLKVVMPAEFQETPMLNLLYTDVDIIKAMDEEIVYSKMADAKILKQAVTEQKPEKTSQSNSEIKVELPKNVKLKFGDD
jgi:cytosine/adenosine deaminase-related metal-dependent hydrolase